MEPLALSTIAKWLGLESTNGSMVHQVVIDSRQALEGSLFVALQGEHKDGHEFVPDVIAKGGFALVKKGEFQHERALPVDDPLTALQEMARCYLANFPRPVIAITGSNGKTTTKDLIAGVLSQKYQVHKTKGNYNNEIGLPLTVLDLAKGDQVLVLEMGMRGRNQITKLTKIAPPDIGVITNIGPVHLELLGSLEAIANAKGELLAGLKPLGLAVLNGDDPMIREQSHRFAGEIRYYGLASHNDLQATEITTDQLGRARYNLVVDKHRYPVTLPISGMHNVHNSLAAIGVGLALELTVEQCLTGLEQVEFSGMRMEIQNVKHGKIINDAYNASPASVQSALQTLASLAEKPRRVAVLGDMLELGELTAKFHEEIGLLAGNTADRVVYVGKYRDLFAKGISKSGIDPQKLWLFTDNQEAQDRIASIVAEGDVVLVKASRGVALEGIVQVLKNSSWGESA